MTWIKANATGVVLSIRVIPRAAVNAIQGLQGDSLKLRLQAPPLDGRANEALIRFLSEKLEIPKYNITLLSGSGTRNKVILINSLDQQTVRARLGMP